MAYYRDGSSVLRAPGLALNGTPGPDTLTGGVDDDLIAGLDGDDILTGLDGVDVLNGGRGADHMDGGLGDDSYWIDAAGDIVVEAVGQGFDTVATSVDYTLPDNIENMILIGAITGIGNDQANLITGDNAEHTIFGMGGDDVLVSGPSIDKMAGGAGNDAYWVTYTYVYLPDIIIEQPDEGFDTVASTASDTYLGANVEQLILLTGALEGHGNEQANILVGNAANNVLDGNGGDDRMIGGLGDDQYFVEQSGDTIIELAGEGIDLVLCYINTYVVPENVEYVHLIGDGGSSTCTGNAQNNMIVAVRTGATLLGLGGDDYLETKGHLGTLVGGQGDDAYVVNPRAVTIVELAGEGFDTVVSSDPHFVLPDNCEQLILAAGAGAMRGTGNAQGNILIGNEQDNVLSGLAGDDVMTGGGRVDIFEVRPGTGHDVITDFGADGAQDVLTVGDYINASITWTTAQVGADTVISFANGDQVTLLNFLEPQLHLSGDNLMP